VDRRRDKGARTRQRIVEATLELLAEGPDAFSASAVAARAGVSKATLFHHFPRLDDVPLAAAEALFVQSVDTGPRPPETLAGFLRSIGKKSLEVTLEHTSFLRAYLVLFVRGLFDDRHRAQMVAMIDGLKGGIEQDLVSRLPNVSAAERRALVHLLAAALDGLGLHYLMRPDAVAFRKSWALLVDALASKYREEESR
jgi:AcrR family transcriptional regulator